MLKVEKVFSSFEDNMKDEILEVIKYGFTDKGLNDLIDYLQDTINDDGSIDQLIDNSIDIYYYDLRVWAVENYNYIDMAIDEFGTDETDFHKLIQLGQYVYYSELYNECISDMVHHIETNYKV